MELTERQEQGGRLEKLIDALDLTQLAIAELVGLSQGYISQQVTGKREIAKRVINFITKNYKNVNIGWLMSGDGEMFIPENNRMLVVEEPRAPYGPDCKEDLFGDLRALLEHYRYRIEGLEAEVVRLGERVRRLEGKENKKPD